MPSQTIQVHLNVPALPHHLVQLLEEAGFNVEEVIEVRGGVFNTADVVSFVVEHIDAVVIGVLAGVVANWISKAQDSVARKGVGFSIQRRTGGDRVVIKVKGDGNWVQVHPRPEPGEEEE